MAVIEAISTTYLEADTTLIEWTSIPSTYEHLQIRASLRDQGTGTYSRIMMRFGTGGGAVDATSGNYSEQNIYAYSSVAKSASGTATHAFGYGLTADDTNPMVPSAAVAIAIINVFDYADTARTTTFFSQGGTYVSEDYATTYAFQAWGGGLWTNTAAIDRVAIVAQAPPYKRGSYATLYGIKAAN